jgi:hypothetical protein
VIEPRTFLGALAGWGLHPAAAAQTRAAALVLSAFADVTRESKIDFRCAASHTAQKYLIETMVGGVAMFDYDGDGANGKFEDVSSRSGQPFTIPLAARGVAFGDLDNVSFIDIVWIVIGEGKGLVRSRPFERTVQ